MKKEGDTVYYYAAWIIQDLCQQSGGNYESQESKSHFENDMYFSGIIYGGIYSLPFLL